MERKIRIVTRGSNLALKQVDIVGNVFAAAGINYEKIIVRSSGDKDLKTPIYETKEPGLFVKVLNQVITDGEADLAVHSAKDIPNEIDQALSIPYYSERGSINDYFVSKVPLSDFSGTVGGSSVRRKRFLSLMNRSITFVNVRGNIETRLRKWERGEADSLVMAKVALDRLGIAVQGEVIDEDLLPPAPNQGFIAVVSRKGSEVEKMLKELADPKSLWEAETERKLMGDLNLGCDLAVSINANYESRTVKFSYASEDRRYDYVFHDYPDKSGLAKLRDVLDE